MNNENAVLSAFCGELLVVLVKAGAIDRKAASALAASVAEIAPRAEVSDYFGRASKLLRESK